MQKYYVHKLTDNNGDHEVHEENCYHLPTEGNRLYLGNFTNCRDAVREAKKHYSQSNGCYWCSRECHTG